MKSYSFRPITVSDMGLFGGSLLKENNAEVIESLGGEPLDINWPSYFNLEARGAIKILGLFKKDILVGYAVFCIAQTLHHKDIKSAMNDTVFIKKSERKGSLGLQLVRSAEQFVRNFGVGQISWFYKAGSPLEKILLRLGYVEDDRSMTKKLVV